MFLLPPLQDSTFDDDRVYPASPLALIGIPPINNRLELCEERVLVRS